MALRSGQVACEWPERTLQPARFIAVEHSSFRAVYYDLEDEADSLLCLTHGKKLWILVHPANTGGLLERICVDNDSERGFTDAVRRLRSLSSRQKSLIFYVILDETKTLYLPYAWLHSVVTLVDKDSVGSLVCTMWYLELPTNEQQIVAMKKRLSEEGEAAREEKMPFSPAR